MVPHILKNELYNLEYGTKIASFWASRMFNFGITIIVIMILMVYNYYA